MNRSTEPETPKSSKTTKTKRHGKGPERCQYRTPTGRQCMGSVLSPQSSFCPRHASYHLTDSSDFSAPLLHNACHFLNAQGINYSLAQLYELLATGRISPRRAAVLAHISSLLMRSLPAIDNDLHPNAGKDAPVPPPKPTITATPNPGKDTVNITVSVPPTPPATIPRGPAPTPPKPLLIEFFNLPIESIYNEADIPEAINSDSSHALHTNAQTSPTTDSENRAPVKAPSKATSSTHKMPSSRHPEKNSSTSNPKNSGDQRNAPSAEPVPQEITPPQPTNAAPIAATLTDATPIAEDRTAPTTPPQDAAPKTSKSNHPHFISGDELPTGTGNLPANAADFAKQVLAHSDIPETAPTEAKPKRNSRTKSKTPTIAKAVQPQLIAVPPPEPRRNYSLPTHFGHNRSG